jgi:tRNA(fMet)-specific endonuclease VapC
MGLKFLLDTNICIYIAKHRPPEVAERFAQTKPGELAISAITYGELRYGAEKSQAPGKSLEKIKAFVELVPVLPLPADAAERYGRLRADLSRLGIPIGMNDLWIAAHALALDAVLVSNNIREFSRVAGLRYENWVNTV